MAPDPRRIPGTQVTAFAHQVTNLAECSRRYGANKKKKRLIGTVLNIDQRQTKTGRTSVYIVAKYDLGGGTMKEAAIHLGGIKVHTPPEAESVAAGTVDAVPVSGATPTDAQAMELEESTIATSTIDQQPPIPQGNSIDRNNSDAADTSIHAPGEEVPIQAEEEETQQPQPTTNNTANIAPPPSPQTRTQTRTPNEFSARTEIATLHGTTWYECAAAVNRPMNGRVPVKKWGIRTVTGEILSEGSDTSKTYSRLDYFLFFIPPIQLNTICRLTNQKLRENNNKETTIGEVLKFFGIWILMCKFEFSSRASLWSTTAPSKYIPAPNFGRTGMCRRRFDELWRWMRFSDQPKERPEGMTSEQYRWRLIDDFVVAFNNHRAANIIPSEEICGDESISRWYGLGGHWINIGLPMYIAMDRKPDSGCEIQNCCDGKSGIMLRLKLVKSAEEEGANIAMDHNGLPHGTSVLKFLVEPWAHTNRIVCADSYFASVTTARVLLGMGLKFIGVVKTATRQFPQAYLSEFEMRQRGDRKGLVAYAEQDPTVPELLAFVWMDRDRRNFISSCSSLQEGREFVRNRWRQIDTTPDADAENIDLTVPQPKAAETYYSVCGKIDQHNRHRQSTLSLENKIETHDWSKRVNMTIVGMCMVDSYLAFKQCTGSTENQKDYYAYLSEELIDNSYDRVGVTSRRMRSGVQVSPTAAAAVDLASGAPRAGASIHLTPTKKKRKRTDGTVTNHALQNKCRECRKKTKYCCSVCLDNRKETWLCYSETGRTCFVNHIDHEHSCD
jgi:hypothetical protein